MTKLKSKAVFNDKTKNYKKYKLSGDCVGTVYVPRHVTDQVIELELELRQDEKNG